MCIFFSWKLNVGAFSNVWQHVADKKFIQPLLSHLLQAFQHVIPVKIIIFLLSQGGASLLNRLVDAARAWAGGGEEAVKVVSLQPLDGTPLSTRIWLSATGIVNFDHILMYHNREVSGNSLASVYALFTPILFVIVLAGTTSDCSGSPISHLRTYFIYVILMIRICK